MYLEQHNHEHFAQWSISWLNNGVQIIIWKEDFFFFLAAMFYMHPLCALDRSSTVESRVGPAYTQANENPLFQKKKKIKPFTELIHIIKIFF